MGKSINLSSSLFLVLNTHTAIQGHIDLGVIQLGIHGGDTWSTRMHGEHNMLIGSGDGHRGSRAIRERIGLETASGRSGCGWCRFLGGVRDLLLHSCGCCRHRSGHPEGGVSILRFQRAGTQIARIIVAQLATCHTLVDIVHIVAHGAGNECLTAADNWNAQI